MVVADPPGIRCPVPATGLAAVPSPAPQPAAAAGWRRWGAWTATAVDRGRRLGLASLLLVVAAWWPAGSFGQAPKPENFALIVGIDNYAGVAGVESLKHARRDAEALEKVLRDRGYNVRILGDENARRSHIVSELTRLAVSTKAIDSVLIFFAGHGIRAKFGERDHLYWLAYDATLDRVEQDGLRMSHLLEYIADIPARRKLLILDHCHSGDALVQRLVAGGGARDAGSTQGVVRAAFPVEEFSAGVSQKVSEGLVVIGAATDKAYEMADLKHGLLTYAILQAFNTNAADENKNGRLSLDELRKHVGSAVAKLARERSVRQEPIDIVRGVNMVDWELFVLPQNAVAALQRLIGNLEARGNLDYPTVNRCQLAIENWRRAADNGTEPERIDRRIVDRLISMSTDSTGTSWESRAIGLHEFVTSLLSQTQ